MSTGPVPTSTAALPLGERLRSGVRRRLSDGLRRSRRDSISIGRAAVAAALAYFVASLLWGHQYPFFSAIVAFIIIGFGTEKKVRKVAELAVGVMLGVLIGELARATIGSGTWQIAVVVIVAGLIARFIDQSVLLGFQMSIQSLLVMIMPVTPTMTPGGRVLDALTGVTVAIVVYLLLSGDPRKVQRRAARSFYRELENTLVSLALAARTGDASVSARRCAASAPARRDSPTSGAPRTTPPTSSPPTPPPGFATPTTSSVCSTCWWARTGRCATSG